MKPLTSLPGRQFETSRGDPGRLLSSLPQGPLATCVLSARAEMKPHSWSWGSALPQGLQLLAELMHL